MSYYSLCGELRLLIHRVELKLRIVLKSIMTIYKLLIHRVELKPLSLPVCNIADCVVANPPCGVETAAMRGNSSMIKTLLIHRVELKRAWKGHTQGLLRVANPPCGVETSIMVSCLQLSNLVANPPCGVETAQIYMFCICILQRC